MFGCCFVCMSGEGLFGIQIYYMWVCPLFCRSGIPMSREYFFQCWIFYSRKWCAQLFAQVAGLHVLTVQTHGVSLGPGFLQAAGIFPIPSYRILLTMGLNARRYPSTQQQTQCHSLSITGQILICSKTDCSLMRIQVSSWLVFKVRVYFVWIPTNVASGA